MRNLGNGTLRLALGLLSAMLASPAPSRAGEPEPAPLLERFFPQLREGRKDLTPFLRDTDLTLLLRTFHFNRTKPDGTENEAWAGGGWLRYRSGWLLDTVGLGATFYGSAPLHAPADKDGTLLLKPGQEGYAVLGEAFAALRYQNYALLKGYRQEFAQTYINPQDSRMTPNTFEAVTLAGKVVGVEYLAGYLWKIKTRNADTFVSMAETAGAKGSDGGVAPVGFRLTPLEGLKIEVSEQYGIDTFNTAYGEVEYLYPINEGWKLRLGAQFTDQRAVGSALVATSKFKRWVTQIGSARVQLTYRDLTLTGGFSITASGNTIQTPWGYPGYLNLIDQEFKRANEKAVLAGLAHDFSRLILPGLSADFAFAAGMDAIDPIKRTPAAGQREYDLTIDYRPTWQRGLWLRVRGALLDAEGAERLGYQVRVILNWEIPLL